MSTLNSEIYEMSVASFDDPSITRAYVNNKILFCLIMQNYLKNAIPLYNNPYSIQDLLSDRVSSTLQEDSFVGDGTTAIYTLTFVPTKYEDSIFSYTIDDVTVVGSYDPILNQVQFPKILDIGEMGNVEVYYVGQFNQTLTDIQKRILSMLLVACWGEKEKNYLLDIRRLMNDTEYRMGSEAFSIKAKNGWFQSMMEDAFKLMNETSWNSFFKQRMG